MTTIDPNPVFPVSVGDFDSCVRLDSRSKWRVEDNEALCTEAGGLPVSADRSGYQHSL